MAKKALTQEEISYYETGLDEVGAKLSAARDALADVDATSQGYGLDEVFEDDEEFVEGVFEDSDIDDIISDIDQALGEIHERRNELKERLIIEA